jgi:hypothetical protein
MDADVPMDPSDSPSDQIVDEGKAPAGAGSVDRCADTDRSVEAQQVPDANTMANDLIEGPRNPVFDDPPQSNPASSPSTEKPKPKSAFVKVMELDEEDMLMAWLEAFFGEFPDMQRGLPPLSLMMTNFRE